jgi:phosphoglycerate dehydrogenase-like enzyme
MSSVSIGPGPGHFAEGGLQPGDRPNIVVLDDYENALRRLADWSVIEARANVTVHTERLRGDALLDAIKDADAIALVRDRTPFPKGLIDQLPRLKLFCFTGARNTTLDAAAMAARGIPVAYTATGSSKESTSEMAWTLILGAAKRVEAHAKLVRRGGWRDGGDLPVVLAGKRLGLVGFGHIGKRVGEIGRAFGMEVVTWSPHMTPERAAEGGAAAVTLEELLSTSHVVSLHLVPSAETRRLLGAARLATMREDSILVNTARSALIDMEALPKALDAGRPRMAALDVYDDEPLARGHPLAARDDVLLLPHLGFVNDPIFAAFAKDTVENLTAWLDGKPLPRLLNG